MWVGIEEARGDQRSCVIQRTAVNECSVAQEWNSVIQLSPFAQWTLEQSEVEVKFVSAPER
jgi:hypothetical protein